MKKVITTMSPAVHSLIRTIRGQRVILDTDLARLFGVTAKRLNEQVKRNREKFPRDFSFQLTPQEVKTNWSQIATSYSQGAYPQEVKTNGPQIAANYRKFRGRSYLPLAFTEHGAIMAANVLNSPQAIQMSVFVVRAFVKMRSVLTETSELSRKLADLEKTLTARVDNCDRAIVNVLQEIMRMLNPPPPPPEPPPKRIGYGVKESRGTYRVRRELCPA